MPIPANVTYPYLFYIAKLRLHIKRISEKIPKEKPKTKKYPRPGEDVVLFRPEMQILPDRTG